MTMVQDAARGTADPGHGALRVIGRQRLAAMLAAVVAAAMLVTGIIGIGKLHPYQVALDFLAAVLLLGACWLLVQRGVRWPVVAVTWLSTLGVVAELGDYQSLKNNTGALAATNTSYFLPGLLWLYLFLLIVVAIVITAMSSAPKGLHG